MNLLYSNFNLIPNLIPDLNQSITTSTDFDTNHSENDYDNNFEEERKVVQIIGFVIYIITNMLLLYLVSVNNIRFSRSIIITSIMLCCLIPMWVYNVYPYELFMCFIMFLIFIILLCRTGADIHLRYMTDDIPENNRNNDSFIV